MKTINLSELSNPKTFENFVTCLTNGDLDGALNAIRTLVEDNENSQSNNSTFEKELKPGRIVKFKFKNTVLYGIIVQGGGIYKINAKGQIEGYIQNYTANVPLEAVAIYEPSKDVFCLHEIEKMKVCWKAVMPKKTVRKSKQDIEKELGLEPGSLEIE